MLWYKAWLETRVRFLISLCGMAMMSSYFVFRQDHQTLKSNGRAAWYYHTLQNGHELIAVMWMMAVILLMMGGLLREKATGTSSFTLALPVSRARLMGVRILSGFIQSIALAVVPWGSMFLVASVTGLANSLTQALFHVVLLIGGGVIFFAAAVLTSSVIEGEYTAPAVCLGIVFMDVVGTGDGFLQAYSPWTFASGTELFNRATGLLDGPIPWQHVIANILVALLLARVSIWAIQRRDF
jgi:ABC-2 type transport system permease protein